LSSKARWGEVLQFTDVSGQGNKRHGHRRPPWLFQAVSACPSHPPRCRTSSRAFVMVTRLLKAQAAVLAHSFTSAFAAAGHHRRNLPLPLLLSLFALVHSSASLVRSPWNPLLCLAHPTLPARPSLLHGRQRSRRGCLTMDQSL
jgi:hypothetical protein